MTTVTASWRLDRNATTRTLWTIFFASTALLAISVRFLSQIEQPAIKPYLFIITTLYVGAILIVLREYIKNKNTELLICAYNSDISIPRFFFKHQHIHFHEIKSVEKYYTPKEMLAVLVGRFDKSSIFIERRRFSSGQEFEEFVRFVDQLALTNRPVKTAEYIEAVSARREAENPSLMIFFTLVFLAIYLAFATSDIEKISDGVITRGALIKGALQISDFYRIPTSFFLHATPFHLGLNILTLAIIGRNINVILGRVRFINILFFSALSGSLFSLAFSAHSTVIGASGGLLGLFGAYFLVCIKHQRELPGSVSASGRAVWLVLALQFLFDATTSGVDIFSHIGGFLFGLLYASCALRRRTAANLNSSSLGEFRSAAIVTLLYVTGIIYFFALYFEFP
jgi:rhomboid protease GluP